MYGPGTASFPPLPAPPADVLADLVVARLIEKGVFIPRPPPVMTLAEAKEFVKRPSTSAFRRWDERFGPTSCGHGRYSRERLERGLEREAKK